ncbi:MAG: hypothetical protein ABIR17_11060 [Pseudolysinimonas sp.]|uniref:hypothetical protein n=1 Tax=Pseudolysinimonas sp. TaxID=2680009 RepID=UPI00326717F2
MILATRIVAYAAAALGAIAYWTIFGDYFERGIWPLLAWYSIAGATLGLRALPVKEQVDRLPEAGLDPIMKGRVRSSLIDIGVIFAISIVAAFLAILTTGANDWGLPLLMQLLVVMAFAMGILVGLLVLMPLGLLATAIVRAAQGRPVAGGVVGIAVLLLATVAFGIVGVLALNGHSDSLFWRTRAYEAMFVVLTGIPTDTISVGSQPLAWVARAIAVAIVALIVYLVKTGFATGRAARASRRQA